MNSVRMYVEDAVGDKYLFTCATNTPEQISSFRRHAAWWKRSGYKASKSGPCAPFKTVIEPYQDSTAP